MAASPRPVAWVAASALIAAAFVGCGGAGHGRSAQTPRLLDALTKRSGCHESGWLPDSACTPGAVLSRVSVTALCTPGYSRRARHVSIAVKHGVYRAYGVRFHRPGSYEVDHLVPLELGGSNVRANLWPEPAGRLGFRAKDEVENYLHAQVCGHRLALGQAQRTIARAWLAVYRQVGPRALTRYR
jgi:hypothetical protein